MQSIRLFGCIVCLSFLLYSYVSVQNQVVHQQFKLQPLVKDVQKLKELNRQMFFEIQQFEDPNQLMLFAQNDQFRHLAFPKQTHIAKLDVKKSEEFFASNE